jgi:uncharacterized protein (TIGR03083 family)
MSTPSNVAAALQEAAAGFATTARAAPDPTRRVKATPEWTVADLVAHVAIECDRYRRAIEGEGEWSDDVTLIHETNRKALAAHTERDVDRNLTWLQESVGRYVAALERRDLDDPSHGFDGGLVITPRQGAGVLLGELLVHRHDLDRQTPMTRDDAALIIDGILHALPVMLDTEKAGDHRGTYEIRVRGYDRYTIRVENGTATTTTGAATGPDAVISSEPVTFVLTSYGRRNQIVAALTGKAVAFGRRPWRALALDRLFHRV